MRTLPILSASLALLAVVSFTSCRPSRVYADKRKTEEPKRHEEPRRYEPRYEEPIPPPPPPRVYSAYSLIIRPTPGFVMQRSRDGRFYHRNPAGFLYWRGYDNRFYLDSRYIHRVRYSNWEYNQWRKYMRGR